MRGSVRGLGRVPGSTSATPEVHSVRGDRPLSDAALRPRPRQLRRVAALGRDGAAALTRATARAGHPRRAAAQPQPGARSDDRLSPRPRRPVYLRANGGRTREVLRAAAGSSRPLDLQLIIHGSIANAPYAALYLLRDYEGEAISTLPVDGHAAAASATVDTRRSLARRGPGQLTDASSCSRARRCTCACFELSIAARLGYRRGHEPKIMKNRIRSLVFSMCLATAALLPAEADAALNAYLTVKGQKQGQIKGGVTKKAQEGKIQVIAVSHEIVSPRDSASGLPTGKVQHKPFVVHKQVDKASPLLYSMLVNNENISTWELGVYQPDAKGVDTLAYTVKLTNASIASMRVISDDDGKLTEVLTFTYQKIEWTWADGGITAMDDWESPVK